MTDYINREDAIKAYAKAFNLADDCIEYASVILKDIPPADVIEVVRCKDCKYWKELLPVCERIHRAGWGVNDYCSYGERKDEGL